MVVGILLTEQGCMYEVVDTVIETSRTTNGRLKM